MPIIFVEKCEKLLQCKSFFHFSTKNISVFGNKVKKHLTSWPLNELIKLTMLWKTGPRCTRRKFSCCENISSYTFSPPKKQGHMPIFLIYTVNSWYFKQWYLYQRFSTFSPFISTRGISNYLYLKVHFLKIYFEIFEVIWDNFYFEISRVERRWFFIQKLEWQ